MKTKLDPNSHDILCAFKTEKESVMKDNSSKESNVNLATSYLSKMVAKLEPLVPAELKTKFGDFALFAAVEAHKEVLQQIKECEASPAGKQNYT